MATNRPFTVSAVLSAIAVRFTNPAAALIADKVLPRQPVGGEKFKYLVYNQSDAYTVPDTKVGRKGRPNQIEFGATEVVAQVDDYALDDVLPQTDIDAAAAQQAEGLSLFDPEALAVANLTSLIMLDREVRVSNIVFNAANYDAARQITLSGTSQFSDYVNSDPLGVIAAGIDACLMKPNQMVIGRQAWTKLRQHPKLVNSITGGTTTSGYVSLQEVQDKLEMEILVGEGFVNVSKPGQVASYSRVWGKNISLIYNNPQAAASAAAGMEGGVTFGFTGQFQSRVAGTIPDPNIGINGGHAVRVGERVKELIVAPAAAYYIANAVA